MGDNDQHGEGGVFGNLPSSRPGTRSPRRERAASDPEPVEAVAPEPVAPEPEPVEAAGPGPVDAEPERAEAEPEPARATGPPPHREPEPEPAEPSGDQAGGGLEDLAWAGIAAAAEAATIGVRLASRAMEALRGSGERR